MINKYMDQISKEIQFDEIIKLNKNVRKNLRKHIKDLKTMRDDRFNYGFGEKNDHYDYSQADNNNQGNYVKYAGISPKLINKILHVIHNGEYLNELKESIKVDDFPLKMLSENVSECKKFLKKMHSNKTPKIKALAKILYGNAFLSLTFLYMESKKAKSTNYIKKIMQTNKNIDKNKSLIEVLESTSRKKHKSKNPQNFFKYTYLKGLMSLLLLNEEHIKEIKSDKICTFGIALIATGFNELRK